jgi:hypothetical protein
MSEHLDLQKVTTAGELLRLYVSTDDNDSLMPTLCNKRDQFLDNLDDVSSAAEVTGLIHWALRENNISPQGETLDEIADRLGDLDIEANTDDYSELIFMIKIAVARLDDIMLDNI